uniref:general transcriptional corepressor trfA-like n=1 Tax=Styela clava TaxID=7725 RepID=UPI00193AD7CF|nr:general transcriptional corepressor trfA-like [Styela clava]
MTESYDLEMTNRGGHDEQDVFSSCSSVRDRDQVIEEAIETLSAIGRNDSTLNNNFWTESENEEFELHQQSTIMVDGDGTAECLMSHKMQDTDVLQSRVIGEKLGKSKLESNNNTNFDESFKQNQTTSVNSTRTKSRQHQVAKKMMNRVSTPVSRKSVRSNQNTSEDNVAATGIELKLRAVKKAWPKLPNGFPMKPRDVSATSTPKTYSRSNTPKQDVRLLRTPEDQHGSLHGNEVSPKSSRGKSKLDGVSTEDLHCNSTSKASNKTTDILINTVSGRDETVPLSFEGSYSCRVIRKEKNVGAKIHSERKRREMELGVPKMVALVGKNNIRGISRESTASRITSKIRSRKNSVVDFFQRRLSVDKLGSRQMKRLESLSQKNKREIHNLAPSTRKKIELHIPVFDETSEEESDENKINFDLLKNTNVNDKNTDESKGKQATEKVAALLGDVHIASKDESSIASDTTYNILQCGTINRRIEELKRLKKSKRKTRALETVTLHINIESSEEEDIAAEKTYKKSVPGINKYSKKVPATMVVSRDKVASLKKISRTTSPGLDKYSSSQCDFVTADTHSSRLETVKSDGPDKQIHSNKVLTSARCKNLKKFETKHSRPNTRSDGLIQWTDECGNVCQVQSDDGKYGDIVLKSRPFSEKSTLSSLGKINQCEFTDTSDALNPGKDPLSPQCVRKKKDASAQVWAALAQTPEAKCATVLNSDQRQHLAKPEGCIIYVDEYGISKRFPLSFPRFVSPISLQ